MRRGLWYFLSAQKVQTKDELLENIRQSIIYDRTTEKQAERSQLYPFTCLSCRTLCEESPCIQMSRIRSTWQRKWLPNGYNWLLSACLSVVLSLNINILSPFVARKEQSARHREKSVIHSSCSRVVSDVPRSSLPWHKMLSFDFWVLRN